MMQRLFDYRNDFTPISLKESEKVKFMKRCDYKYVLDTPALDRLLSELWENYFLLQVDGKSEQQYHTVYFDTPGDDMYLAHHNGRNHRLKVRKREYIDSHIRFLEIKIKDLKGRTDKIRTPAPLGLIGEMSGQEHLFLNDKLGKELPVLKEKLENRFTRVTLVNKHFNERVTVDYGLSFITRQREMSFQRLAIIEVKCEKHLNDSFISSLLKKEGIRCQGFSKYCIGRALADTSLKQNRFKEKIRQLEKYY